MKKIEVVFNQLLSAEDRLTQSISLLKKYAIFIKNQRSDNAKAVTHPLKKHINIWGGVIVALLAVNIFLTISTTPTPSKKDVITIPKKDIANWTQTKTHIIFTLKKEGGAE